MSGGGGAVSAFDCISVVLLFIASINFKRLRIFTVLLDMLRRSFSFCAVICVILLIAGIINNCILAATGTLKRDYKLPNYVHDNYCKL
jgi:hypothetical protein